MRVRCAKVLVIDDHPGAAALTTAALESRGCRALVYGSREWLEADGFRPDVVLLDLAVRRRDGAGLAATLRAHPAFRHVPILLTGTQSPDDDLVRASMTHAEAYIPKPIDLDALLRQIGRFVVLPREDDTPDPSGA